MAESIDYEALAEQVRQRHAKTDSTAAPDATATPAIAQPAAKGGENPIVGFLSELQSLNLPAQAKGIYQGSQALSEAAQGRPGALVGMGKAVLSGQDKVRQEALEAFRGGDPATGLVKSLYWLLPLIGPPLNRAGNLLNEGEIARGLGATADVGLQVAGPKMVKGAAEAMGMRKAAKLQGQSGKLIKKALNPKGDVAKERVDRLTPVIQKKRITGDQPALHERAYQDVKRGASMRVGAMADDVNRQVPTSDLLKEIAARRAEMQSPRPAAMGGPVPYDDARTRALNSIDDKVRGHGKTMTVGEMDKYRRALDRRAKWDAQTPSAAPGVEDIKWASHQLRQKVRGNVAEVETFDEANRIIGEAASLLKAAKKLKHNPPTSPAHPLAYSSGAGVVAGGAATAGAYALGQPGVAAVVGPGALVTTSYVVHWLRNRRSTTKWMLMASDKKIQLANALLSGDRARIAESMAKVDAALAAGKKSSESESSQTPRRAK